MPTQRTKCDDCPPRKQCEDCRGYDEFVERLASSLADKMAKALTDRYR